MDSEPTQSFGYYLECWVLVDQGTVPDPNVVPIFVWFLPSSAVQRLNSWQSICERNKHNNARC